MIWKIGSDALPVNQIGNMKTAIFTPTRHPGIGVSFWSVARQDPPVDHWFVADQLAPERERFYEIFRDHFTNSGKKTQIHTLQAEILPGRNGNLEHVSNWALNKARELEVELLVFLQDFIWLPPDAVTKFVKAAKYHPFDLLTGNVVASPGFECKRSEYANLYSIFAASEVTKKPPEPYTPDTRDQMGYGVNIGGPDPGRHLSNHAWEINWGALPHALINAGVDFDEDYDYGTAWGNTDFSFQIHKAFNEPVYRHKGRVWWDYYNQAISMPHREYFPKAHEGERDLDNGHRFRAKWGNV